MPDLLSCIIACIGCLTFGVFAGAAYVTARERWRINEAARKLDAQEIDRFYREGEDDD